MPKVETSSKSKGVTLADICITFEAVKGRLRKINPNKAFGPDGIPAIVLKELHSELAVPCVFFSLNHMNKLMCPRTEKKHRLQLYLTKAQEVIQEIIAQYR